MYLRCALTVLLCGAAHFGDYLVFKSKFSEAQVFRAVADSAVHAIIGFLSAIIFFTYELRISSYAYLVNVAFCTIMSSFIDIDHAIVARSLYWKDITKVKQRGIFHCTTFWLALTTILLVYSCIHKKIHLYFCSFMLILAYSSHHIRDGNRRGLWMFPFGHTKPIEKYIYILALSVMPHLWAGLYMCMKTGVYKNRIIYFKV